MLLFARLVVWVGEFLPKESNFTWHFCEMFEYEECKKEVVEWHRTKLEKLDPIWYQSQMEKLNFEEYRKKLEQMDPAFRLQQASLKLIMLRERARAEGIGPTDPRYPDISDVYPSPFARFLKTGRGTIEN